MIIQSYQSLSANEREGFFSFLKSTQQKKSPASVNMWNEQWKTKPETLPFLLENTKRFNGTNGEFHILYDNKIPIACGGVYISEFSKYIALVGVRTWVSDEYRHASILREFILPFQKKWCIENNIKIAALSFNEYNKNLIQVFKRRRLGESTDRLNSRQPHHLFFNGVNEVPYPVVIQYTSQWVIYEQLDLNFEFDWGCIIP
jgi:hypothetical protein